MSRSKYWCFTLNNYNENEEQAIQNIVTEEIVTYLVYGKEVGESGTRHLQGYIELSRRWRLTQIKRLLGRRAHIEARRGTSQEADEYCKKDDTHPFIYGTLSIPRQGNRSDLSALQESLRNGRNLRFIAEEHFGQFLRYQRGITAYRLINSIQRTWQTQVIVYWGATGTGKTSAVHENLPSLDSLYTHVGNNWFDGYDGQPIVLFDDFSGADFKLPYLLKLLDRYPMKVPIKGGFVEWAPYEIYITSNLDPKDWFPNAHAEHVAALFRRIGFSFHFE